MHYLQALQLVLSIQPNQTERLFYHTISIANSRLQVLVAKYTYRIKIILNIHIFLSKYKILSYIALEKENKEKEKQ